VRIDRPPTDAPPDPSWWSPLEAVARKIAGERRYRFFDVADFSVCFRVLRAPRRPDVTVYEHRLTRDPLALDDAGGAYRFIESGPGARTLGRFVSHRTLRAALDELDLWELPWLKDGLEEFRRGLGWENRLLLHPDYPEWLEFEDQEQEFDAAPRRRGHLRLVRWRPMAW
jgi:hypothetical protein